MRMAVMIIIQVGLCLFITLREFRNFLSARDSLAQTSSYYSYYVSSPAYKVDLARKQAAGPNEVVITEGDFINGMIEGWKSTASRHRNGCFLIGVATTLALLQTLVLYRRLRRHA